jgi:hypothetical protein
MLRQPEVLVVAQLAAPVSPGAQFATPVRRKESLAQSQRIGYPQTAIFAHSPTRAQPSIWPFGFVEASLSRHSSVPDVKSPHPMPDFHRKPNRLAPVSYRGRRSYFLTLCTGERRTLFTDATLVNAVLDVLRATCASHSFRVYAYWLYAGSPTPHPQWRKRFVQPAPSGTAIQEPSVARSAKDRNHQPVAKRILRPRLA